VVNNSDVSTDGKPTDLHVTRLRPGEHLPRVRDLVEILVLCRHLQSSLAREDDGLHVACVPHGTDQALHPVTGRVGLAGVDEVVGPDLTGCVGQRLAHALGGVEGDLHARDHRVGEGTVGSDWPILHLDQEMAKCEGGREREEEEEGKKATIHMHYTHTSIHRI